MSERAPAPHLRLQVRHVQGSLRLDVAFDLTQPWTVLFGPSGSGKTTLLRTIAGFVRPDAGRLVHGREGTVLVDRVQGIFVPAHRRPVRSAGQTPRLFPHMTVRKNVLFGCGQAGEQTEIADEVLRLFGLSALAGRRPGGLSGGETQRVSVARAVLSAITAAGITPAGGRQNTLLLLDEPFSGLGMAMREDLAGRLREALARWGTPVLSVTHDVGEAFQMGAEVIVLDEGRVRAQGQAEEVLAEERERVVRRLGGDGKG